MKNFLAATLSSLAVAFVGCTYVLFSDLNVLEAKTNLMYRYMAEIKEDLVGRLDRIENKIDKLEERSVQR